MKKLLFNTAHPLSESGKPIFIPFGEWTYDGKSRQRLDRAHGEKIANELNARVAKGEPGIPVYQGHPDVPELAAKYPDKGALGWVTHIELVNEDPTNYQLPTNQLPAKSGLALTVEWDRDPGKGFRWFSPYWLANERDGSTYIVGTIASIGLVNNPNIPEFRLANETQSTSVSPKRLAPAIIELAAKYDRLANEANFDESKHPRANDGKFTSGGGGSSATVKKVDPASTPGHRQEQEKNRQLDAQVAKNRQRTSQFFAERASHEVRMQKMVRNAATRLDQANYINNVLAHEKSEAAISAAHRTAVYAGLKYNPKTHQYE